MRELYHQWQQEQIDRKQFFYLQTMTHIGWESQRGFYEDLDKAEEDAIAISDSRKTAVRILHLGEPIVHFYKGSVVEEY